MFMILLGFAPAIIITIILFLINPILGVLGVAWFVGVAVYVWNYAWRKNEIYEKD